MEEESVGLLVRLLPKEWVLHHYAPDYGIDKVIEIFEPIESGSSTSETLGQHLMLQLKSVESCKTRMLTVRGRGNVAKPPLTFRLDEAETEIEVVPFSIDTDTLATVARMGTAVPVVLILLCLECQQGWFLSLTDLIDKVLDPEHPDWRNQATKTIYIPVQNRIDGVRDGVGDIHLRFLSRRGKLQGLFSQVAYQFHELHFPEQFEDVGLTVGLWADRLLTLDIWNTPEWAPLPELGGELAKFRIESMDRAVRPEAAHARAYELWRRLDNLSRIHEELCREWGLPTVLSQLLSYPN
jgi:Domain of unknown function (DUF4365)